MPDYHKRAPVKISCSPELDQLLQGLTSMNDDDNDHNVNDGMIELWNMIQELQDDIENIRNDVELRLNRIEQDMRRRQGENVFIVNELQNS